jgi:hypothetical protein
MIQRRGLAKILLIIWLFPITACLWSCDRNNSTAGNDTRIPFAVLGDSDSHAYQDFILLPADNIHRGGAFRATTWQWTEALNTFRHAYIDQGEWNTWGTTIKVAETLDWLHLNGRAPRKQDFEYNFAVSGAECSDLVQGYYRQAPRLVSLMDAQPEKWQRGIVVIRIGVNSIGQNAALNRYAASGVTTASMQEVIQCANWIQQAIEAIHLHHPATRIVLVGIFNNAHWVPNFQLWGSAAEQNNINQVLDIFDQALIKMANDDASIIFFSDRNWFKQNWGGRDENGQLAYHELVIDNQFTINHTQGNAPNNMILADGHAGTAWNTLWAKALIDLLNQSFALNIPPITDNEISTFMQQNTALTNASTNQ